MESENGKAIQKALEVYRTAMEQAGFPILENALNATNSEAQRSANKTYLETAINSERNQVRSV